MCCVNCHTVTVTLLSIITQLVCAFLVQFKGSDNQVIAQHLGELRPQDPLLPEILYSFGADFRVRVRRGLKCVNAWHDVLDFVQVESLFLIPCQQR